MEALAPIVDQLRVLSREELPTPRTCAVRLWDDGTFDAQVFHSMGSDETQRLKYERTTGEIVWEHVDGGGWRTEAVSGGETIHEPVVAEAHVRVVATVAPPYG